MSSDRPTYVFGDEVGRPIGDVKTAWITAVLKAHGHVPEWVWKKGKSRKGSSGLSPESREAYRTINLHFHDLRHKAGSRLLEAGWPLHHVQQMLGHSDLKQTSTYLNATLRGLHQSMRELEEARRACKSVASEPQIDLRPSCNEVPASGANTLIH